MAPASAASTNRRERMLRLLVRAAVVLLAMAIVVPSARAAGPPPGFFGVVPQAPPGSTDLSRMEGTVETVRLPIFWFECEPTPGHYAFGTLDAEIGAAADHGIAVMPFVYGRPEWLGKQNHPPLGGRAMKSWRRFLRVLVGRYGPQGSFWLGRAKLLRRADRGAKIVLAGVAPVGAGMKTWVFMRRLLRVPGVRGDFDFAAVHPYSATIPELDYQLEKVRQAMVAGGAGRKPLIVTEFGVASGGGYPSAFIVGARGQAEFLRAAYRRLLAMRHRWRIAGAYWFTWQDAPRPDPHCGFCQGAGLFRLGGTAKPAWIAFRKVITAAAG